MSASVACGWHTRVKSALRRMYSRRGPQKSGQSFRNASSMLDAANERFSGGTDSSGLNARGRPASGTSK